MARFAEGFKLYRDPRSGLYFVRFRHAGRRYNLSTGTGDPHLAQAEAVRLYGDTISGARPPKPTPYPPPVAQPEPIGDTKAEPEDPIDVAAAKWIAAVETSLDPLTVKQFQMYVRAHWQPFFRRVSAITTARVEAYKAERLGQVKRTTVNKELSALRSFTAWAVKHGVMAVAPAITNPGRRVTGTPDKKRPHKASAVELDESEAESFLRELPERSPGGPRGGPFVVRARFEVAWETSLRPATLSGLSVPEHYTKGSKVLRITNEIDKIRLGRELPITDRARAALDRVCPARGLIFGDHDYRHYIREAAKRADLAPHKLAWISAYDLRHGRLTLWGERAPNLPGMQYLAGHLHATTTDKYLKRSKRAALDVLQRSQASPGSSADPRALLEAIVSAIATSDPRVAEILRVAIALLSDPTTRPNR